MTAVDDLGDPDTHTQGPDAPPQDGVTASRAGTSILTLATTLTGLEETWESVREQSDPGWQWIVALPDGVDEPGWLVAARAHEVRVTVRGRVAGHVGRAFTDALEDADGEVVLPLAPGDVLARDAVAALADAASVRGWAYGDEIIRLGGGAAPYEWSKPELCPEWWRTQPPLIATAALSRAALLAAGGLRPELGTAVWYDAVLRVSERERGVRLSQVVVERPDGDVWRGLTAEDAALAVVAQCERLGDPAVDVTPVVVGGWRVGQRLHRRLLREPSVSIVIPTRGTSSVVRGRSRCHVVELARSLWTAGRYAGLEEVVVVHDQETPPGVLEQLSGLLGDALVAVPFTEPFNFSRKCNVGALVSRGELVCFLNDDTEIVDPEWLGEMVAQLASPDVAAVGGRLLLADGTLQHVGHEYDRGAAGHPLFGRPADTLGLAGAAHVAGERSGVTAACLLVRRSDFVAVGGFSGILPLNYNDADLCLKLRQHGRRVIFTPHAELYHFESQTRVARSLSWERGLLERRWASVLQQDPYLRTNAPASLREPSEVPSRCTAAGQDHEHGRGAA